MRRSSSKALAPASVAPAVQLFAMLANPLRLRLLLVIAHEGAASAGELQRLVDAEQTAVSHQLALLRRHRLVVAERDGRRRVYRLLDHHVAHIVEDAIKHASEKG